MSAELLVLGGLGVAFVCLAAALVLCLVERFRRDAHIRKMARAYRERMS